jgi:hypothetical protein
VGEVDDASIDKGPAVDDANVHSLVVAEIHYTYPGIKRQSAVGGHERLHVVNLAIGGLTAVVRVAVPARDAGFGVADPGHDGPRLHAGCRRRRRRDSGVLLVPAGGERYGKGPECEK